MSEPIKITQSGKYDATVTNAMFSSKKSKDANGNEIDKDYIFFVFECDNGAVVEYNQWLTSEKALEFAEKQLCKTFDIREGTPIEVILDKFLTDKTVFVGKRAKLIINEEKFIDKNGNERSSFKVSFLNNIKDTFEPQAAKLPDLRARIKAIRTGIPTTPTTQRAAPASARPATPPSDELNEDCPF